MLQKADTIIRLLPCELASVKSNSIRNTSVRLGLSTSCRGRVELGRRGRWRRRRTSRCPRSATGRGWIRVPRKTKAWSAAIDQQIDDVNQRRRRRRSLILVSPAQGKRFKSCNRLLVIEQLCKLARVIIK